MTNNPFETELARHQSHYFGTKDGRPLLLSDPDKLPDLFASAVIGAFRGFVLNPQFVCLGARRLSTTRPTGSGCTTGWRAWRRPPA